MKTRCRRPFGWALLLVGLLTVAIGLSAHAESPTVTPSCDADDECNRLANEAINASQAGHFKDAQRWYRAAYAKQHDPKLLYNLARVLHKAGQFVEAVTYYKQYIDAGAEGSAEQRKKAEQRLQEARREQVLAAASAKPPLYRQWWLWTVVGVAAVGVAVGVGLGLEARKPDLTGYSDARPFGS